VKQKQNKKCRDKTVQASKMRSVVALTSLGRYRSLPDVQDVEIDQAFENLADDELILIVGNNVGILQNFLAVFLGSRLFPGRDGGAVKTAFGSLFS
jgi:hypothetical protein